LSPWSRGPEKRCLAGDKWSRYTAAKISEEEYPDVGRVVFAPTGVRTSEEREH
jgi:hypothetical protein